MDVPHQVSLAQSMEVVLHTVSVFELLGEVSSSILELLLQLVPSGFSICRAHGLFGRCLRVIEPLQQLGVDTYTLVEEQTDGKSLAWGLGLKICVLDFQGPTNHLLVEPRFLHVGLVNTCGLC